MLIDEMDLIYIESQPLFLTKMSIDELKHKFQLNPDEKWSAYLTKEAIKFKIKQKRTYKQLFEENFKNLIEHREYLINYVFNGEPQNNINYASSYSKNNEKYLW